MHTSKKTEKKSLQHKYANKETEKNIYPEWIYNIYEEKNILRP